MEYCDLQLIASGNLTKNKLCEILMISFDELCGIIKKYKIPYSEPKYRRWTKEEDETIAKMKKEGKKNYQIAYTLDRKIDQIEVRIHKLKLSEDKNNWTVEECNQLMFMRRQSICYKDISFILGRTRFACSKKHHELKRKKVEKNESVQN
jgi:DNA-binding CsgD family transcriptional regulator